MLKRLSERLILLCLALFCTTAAAQQATVKSLAPNVYAIHLLNYTSLVVIGDKDVLITDTANPYRADLLAREIAKLTDKAVGKIVLSHEHFDHVGGSARFAEAEIYAQRNIRAYRRVDPLNMLPAKIHHTFEREMTIDMGTTQVVLKHLGIADGAAIAVVHLPRERIALTADMYVDGGVGPGVYLTDTNLLGNLHTLRTLQSWNLTHAINVHSASTELSHLNAAVAFLQDLYAAVLPEVQRSLQEEPHNLVSNILAMSKSLSMPKYAHWPHYDDLHHYARKMAFAMIHGG